MMWRADAEPRQARDSVTSARLRAARSVSAKHLHVRTVVIESFRCDRTCMRTPQAGIALELGAPACTGSPQVPSRGPLMSGLEDH